MKHLCLLILSFSGLVCVGVCKPREYILIKELKTWTDAQAYCRLNHNDLATVQTDEDRTNLRQTASENAFTSYGWIGLYNDINSWRWSYQDEGVAFDRWIIGQPDNYGAGEECAVIRLGGNWYDRVCTEEKHFLCFEEKNGTVKYDLVKNDMTWSDARKHCRDRYTDLVTIRDETENEELRVLMYWSTEVWTGLFRDSWKWSDRSNLSDSNEASAKNLNGGTQNCATSTYYGSMENWLCSTTFNFYCNTVKFKRQIVKVQVTSNVGNVDDARLQTLVMKKLKQTLSGLTADEDLKMKWRKQENGNVFQKQVALLKSANGSSVCQAASL
ncbi:putative C-type lectin domain family 20 member A isoform X2 [Triplophysa rosa]|uniref:Macrophage mannose receptor 1-like n=1 Tax=Triplophysa rosa TaxID=992332 RepID=A0A9W8C7C9_TRIRA|nr:putative C-type lectin domain family 20 member A isoform X2 [Triplophysa rosa]XP_057189942.1 putative C-type lectin domain family 20 member A isoform X2 [Triplophysa rosa]KAI7810056.1 putative macrophage mannose receptor 1-like [Triplophysa rosa]